MGSVRTVTVGFVLKEIQYTDMVLRLVNAIRSSEVGHAVKSKITKLGSY